MANYKCQNLNIAWTYFPENHMPNINDKYIYRNLSKPISVQDEGKEKKYKDNYEVML